MGTEEQTMSLAAEHLPADTELTEEDLRLIRKYSKRFVGAYSHSLDTKGRLVVPQPFRDGLGSAFTIAPSQDFKAVCLYSDLEWARLRDRYEQMSANSKVRKFLVMFDAFSYHGQEFDAQGRILIPNRIRKQILGEEKDMEITGAGCAVRITATSVSDSLMADFLSSLDDIEAEMDSLSREP